MKAARRGSWTCGATSLRNTGPTRVRQPSREVTVGNDSYTNQYGTTFVMVFAIADWIADDGTTLLSMVGPARRRADGRAEANLPF